MHNHTQNPEDVDDLSAKCRKAAEDWAIVADELWAYSRQCKERCKEQKRAELELPS